MTKKIVVFFLALASFISVDAQNEVLGAYVKKGGTESGINATSRFLQRCFPDNDPKAKVFTPDIQLSYDDYRKYDFCKDAELLYLIEMK